MTAYVLVPGAHTGGWIWRETAARLRESGAEVFAATLTGLGDRRHLAGPGTDLDTHIEDLVRLIDHIDPMDEPQVVIVGHCYGIHPVLGAADRRPERIARIVYLDAGLPQDGDPALALVADPAVHDWLHHRAGPTVPSEQAGQAGQAGQTGHAVQTEQTEGDWLVPPPLHAWHRWGSTAGVPAQVLARLDRLAAPQPQGTLTQPLRLSAAVFELPTTGVLCTANGSSIAMVEGLVGLGDPRLQGLADPRVSFFELDTGHWPMLSRPDELAEVLIQAAAGEGHRIERTDERPGHLRPFLLDVPECRRERVGNVDLYLPDADASRPQGDQEAGPDRPRPAVVFVQGGPVAPGVHPKPRDWPGFVGYGRYAASLGAVGVTLDHGLHSLADFERAAQDVAEAVELVRADPCVDAERVALWFFSVGGLLSADWLAAPPPWLRCVAATYPILAPLPNWGRVDSRFRPAAAVRAAGRLPIVLTRVEKERAEIAASVQEFLAAAEDCAADVEVIDVPLGRHGFETIDHTDQARHAVEHAMRSVLERLERCGSAGSLGR